MDSKTNVQFNDRKCTLNQKALKGAVNQKKASNKYAEISISLIIKPKPLKQMCFIYKMLKILKHRAKTNIRRNGPKENCTYTTNTIMKTQI